MHLAAKDTLEVLARLHADLLDLAALGTDDDALLAIALDVDDRPDTHEAPVLDALDVLDDDTDRMGNLVEGRTQNLLANELGDEHLVGKVDTRILGKPARARGKQIVDGVDEVIETTVVLGGNDDLGVKVAQATCLLKALGDDGFLDEVGPWR